MSDNTKAKDAKKKKTEQSKSETKSLDENKSSDNKSLDNNDDPVFKIASTSDQTDNSQKNETKDENKNEDENPKKRKAEDEGDNKSAKKPKPKVLSYIPWQYLTEPVWEKCAKFADPYVPTGKASMVKIMWDYNKFKEMCPECPEVNPPKSKVLYTNHPFLKSSFGYSPYLADDGKVSNQLRFEFDDYILQESRRFKGEFTKDEIEKNNKADALEKEAEDLLIQAKELEKKEAEKAKELKEQANSKKKEAEKLRVHPYGVKGWDQFFMKVILKNHEKWGTQIKVLTKLADKGETPTMKDVARGWKSSAREAVKSAFSEYFQLRLLTQREQPSKGIKEDPYTALLPVWDMEGKLITNKLYQKNSTDYDGEDAKVIFDKGMYGQGIFSVDHINFTTKDYGLSCTETQLKIATREEIEPDEEDEEEELQCPF